MEIIKQKIKKVLEDNLEVVHVKDGGGDSTAIAAKLSTEGFCQDDSDISLEAKHLTDLIMKEIGPILAPPKKDPLMG